MNTGHSIIRPGYLPLIALLLCCSPVGRVLHVDNRNNVPYSAQDDKLKQRVLRALLKRKLISGEQRYTCQVNIMQIGQEYMVEVWPDGISSGCWFGVKLKKPLMQPIERYMDCRDTAAAAGSGVPVK